MDNITVLEATLTHYGLASALTGYISRKDITARVSWKEFEAFIKTQDHEIVTEPGNIYGKVSVQPATVKAAPIMRLITRSDVAAQFGSGRRA